MLSAWRVSPTLRCNKSILNFKGHKFESQRNTSIEVFRNIVNKAYEVFSRFTFWRKIDTFLGDKNKMFISFGHTTLSRGEAREPFIASKIKDVKDEE